MRFLKYNEFLNENLEPIERDENFNGMLPIIEDKDDFEVNLMSLFQIKVMNPALDNSFPALCEDDFIDVHYNFKSPRSYEHSISCEVYFAKGRYTDEIFDGPSSGKERYYVRVPLYGIRENLYIEDFTDEWERPRFDHAKTWNPKYNIEQYYPVLVDIKKKIKELTTPEKIEQFKHIARGAIHGKQFGL